MRQETNNEIDLLLRRLSRGHDASRSDGDLQIDGGHLDADELSAYAENALPAAARTRYTEHLAECSGCRELVVQLSSSAGVVIAEDTASTPGRSGFSNFLASLFSPLVLRYSIPALGLIVLAVIGIGLWPRGNGDTDVALKTPAVNNQSSPASEQPQSSPQDMIAQHQDSARSTPATAPASGRASQAEQAPAPPSSVAPAATGTPAENKEAVEKKEEQQPSINAYAVPAVPKSSVANDEIKRTADAEARKQEGQIRVAQTEVAREKAKEPSSSEGRRDEVAAARSPAKTRNEKSDSKAMPGVGGAIATFQRDGLAGKDKDDAETRLVAGRRFRKQRGIWIDTAYDSSRNAITLTRGSEQFRALVADEPDIKTIADQLNGEVIVVWKGHTYKIR
jgi:Putative zinc-finger